MRNTVQDRKQDDEEDFVTSKRAFAIVVGVLFVFALTAGTPALACDKHAKAAAEVAVDKGGCAKAAEAKAEGEGCAKKAAQVAANGNAAEAKPCAGKAEGEGCAKKKAAQVAEAKPADGETAEKNPVR